MRNNGFFYKYGGNIYIWWVRSKLAEISIFILFSVPCTVRKSTALSSFIEHTMSLKLNGRWKCLNTQFHAYPAIKCRIQVEVKKNKNVPNFIFFLPPDTDKAREARELGDAPVAVCSQRRALCLAALVFSAMFATALLVVYATPQPGQLVYEFLYIKKKLN